MEKATLSTLRAVFLRCDFRPGTNRVRVLARPAITAARVGSCSPGSVAGPGSAAASGSTLPAAAITIATAPVARIVPAIASVLDRFRFDKGINVIAWHVHLLDVRAK